MEAEVLLNLIFPSNLIPLSLPQTLFCSGIVLNGPWQSVFINTHLRTYAQIHSNSPDYLHIYIHNNGYEQTVINCHLKKSDNPVDPGKNDARYAQPESDVI